MPWIPVLLAVTALLGGCAGTDYDPNRPAWYHPLPPNQPAPRQVLPDNAFMAEEALPLPCA